jgi:hypothetical protein
VISQRLNTPFETEGGSIQWHFNAAFLMPDGSNERVPISSSSSKG